MIRISLAVIVALGLLSTSATSQEAVPPQRIGDLLICPSGYRLDNGVSATVFISLTTLRRWATSGTASPATDGLLTGVSRSSSLTTLRQWATIGTVSQVFGGSEPRANLSLFHPTLTHLSGALAALGCLDVRKG